MNRIFYFTTILAIATSLIITGCAGDNKTATGQQAQPAISQTSDTDDAATAQQQTSSQSAADAPSISFEKTVHDFGKIGPGTTSECTFKFKNTGQDTLRIKDITKTCGCTPYSLDKKTFAPGETGSLRVIYHASKQPGKVNKTLYVSSSDPQNPRVQLNIKANIVRKVSVEPTRLKLLLNKPNADCPTITLNSTDGRKFAIKSLDSTRDCIIAQVDPSVEKQSFVIEPKVDLDKLKKNLNGMIRLRLSHPECTEVVIPYDTMEEYKVDPPLLIIFNAEPGKKIEKQIWVMNNYGNDFEIESISATDDIIKVINQQKVGGRYKLNLSITPPDNDSRFFRDTLNVKLTDGKNLNVRCRGFYSKK